jgi:hypothetical protein
MILISVGYVPVVQMRVVACEVQLECPRTILRLYQDLTLCLDIKHWYTDLMTLWHIDGPRRASSHRNEYRRCFCIDVSF